MIRSLGIASLFLARPNALPLVGLSAFVAAALLWWSYRNAAGVPALARISAMAAKFCGILLLLTCWLEPQWLSYLPKQKANVAVVLSDNSRSMRLPEVTGGVSRGDRLLDILRSGGASWREKLERQFRVRSFSFGLGLREMGTSADLAFDESPSNLGAALQAARERVGEGPAGIVVFTDGIASDLSDFDAANLPPIFPVMVGQELHSPDIALGTIATSLSAFEEAPVTVRAEVRTRGLGQISARVRIESIESTPVSNKTCVAESRVTVSPETGRAMAQLQFATMHGGPSFYRISVDCPEVVPSTELTLENNTRLVCVNRGAGPHKLLYVAGRPNWEFGPMRRALEEDPELQLRGLVRVAKREPKFTFKGRGGEATNPLFRGFQAGENMDVQRYDQPVIVRINVDSGDELVGGFPKTARELFQFKAIIIGDLEAEFFTAEQLRLLQRFVSERGGGLLMLGGMESFEGGGWQGTPVDSILPVWLGADRPQESASYQWKLTREGLLEPWMRRRKAEREEEQRQDLLPGLEVINGVHGIKPAASLLAVGAGKATGSESRPLLAVQRYGLGRTGALLAGDMFQLGIGRPELVSDLSKFWRQLARWLVTDTPNLVELSAQSLPSAKSIRLAVRVRDEEARAVDDADVEVRVKRAGDTDAAAIVVRAEPTSDPGLYSFDYPATTNGALLAIATAKNSAGTTIGESTVGWVQDDSEAEFAGVSPNRKAMEELARKTGGAVLSVGELDALAERLARTPNLTLEASTRPLWHTGTVFVLALCCFVLEWVLRRRHGVA